MPPRITRKMVLLTTLSKHKWVRVNCPTKWKRKEKSSNLRNKRRHNRQLFRILYLNTNLWMMKSGNKTLKIFFKRKIVSFLINISLHSFNIHARNWMKGSQILLISKPSTIFMIFTTISILKNLNSPWLELKNKT